MTIVVMKITVYDITANVISLIENVSSFMKIGLDKNKIIEVAAKIVDEKGTAALSMKELADKLAVKPPSLYKHFSGGLDELNTELMLYGYHCLDLEIMKAAVGKEKDNAIIAICNAFRDFAQKHKGLFDTMQWYNMYLSKDHLQASEGTVEVMFQVLGAYGLTETQKVHCVRMLRALIQGFTTIESHGGYGNPVSLDDTFDYAVRTFLNGIREIQGGNLQC